MIIYNYFLGGIYKFIYNMFLRTCNTPLSSCTAKVIKKKSNMNYAQVKIKSLFV